jgi:branched-chain amino acid aminotransferase
VPDEPDWGRLGGTFLPPDEMFSCHGHAPGQGAGDPVWDAGEWRPFGPLDVSPASPALNYSLSVFEGMKAHRAADGRVLLFRPAYNAARFRRSALRMALGPFPEARFVELVSELVRRNLRLVPPAGRGSFYVRPLEYAADTRLWLAAPSSFVVTFYGAPVGSYFARDTTAGVRLLVLEQGRTAPGGTGDVKTGANYAGGIARARDAKARGFDDVLYLDARETRFVTETSGANVFVVLRDGTLVTPPLDDQVLAGSTRGAVLRVARELFGLTVEERAVALDEVLADAVELFCTGTAWTVQRVRELEHRGRTHTFPGDGLRTRLFEVVHGVQTGAREDPFGWVYQV